MSTFGEDLIQSLNEALAHAQGEGPAIVHAPVTPREVRERTDAALDEVGDGGVADGPNAIQRLGKRIEEQTEYRQATGSAPDRPASDARRTE